MTKKLKIDSSIQERDTTMTVYQERVESLLPNDRQNLHISIPFETELERMQKRFDDLNNDKMKMFIANALIELARSAAKRFKIDLINDTSINRLQQFASSITDAQLRELNIPSKYGKPLRNLNIVCSL